MKTNSFFKVCLFALIITSAFAFIPEAQARDPWFTRGPSYHHDHHRDHYRTPYRGSRYRRPVEFEVQYALARRGYYRGPIDGHMGAVAQRAVRDYQRDHRLAVTGNINKDVLRSLGLL